MSTLRSVRLGRMQSTGKSWRAVVGAISFWAKFVRWSISRKAQYGSPLGSRERNHTTRPRQAGAESSVQRATATEPRMIAR